MFFKLLKKLRKDQDGATAIEYGLIAALISIAAIGALGLVGDALEDTFNTVEQQLTGAAEGDAPE